MASNIKNIRKLQTAINQQCDYKILYGTSQFYSAKQNRPVTKYILRQAVLNEETGKTEATELFSTYSQMQVILYLRDYLFTLLGKELPANNELWNEIKERDNINFKDVIKGE